MTSLGLAFSGGGITGLLASLCVLNSMNQTYPGLLSREDGSLLLSTSSGGSIGTGLYTNAGDKMYFPAYSPDITYAEAKEENTSSSSPYWFGRVLEYLPSYKQSVKVGPTERGWWIDVIDTAFYVGYGVHDYNIIPGRLPWYANFGLMVQKACPISRDSSGIYKDAKDNLRMAVREMVEGVITPDLPSTNVTALDAMSYSSSYWAASIIENRAEYDVLKHTLEQNSDYYFTDGGLIDTTAIVALLQQKTDSIIAFYNNNNDLTVINSSFAFLFGKTTTTDSMNSLEGPELAQVFPSNTFDEIIANLTNPSILRARVAGLKVLKNSYLGVEAYTLSNLYILSNQFSEEFADSFVDKDIPSGLNKDFPNKFSAGIPALDANVLCMFNQWKIGKYKAEISKIIG